MQRQSANTADDDRELPEEELVDYDTDSRMASEEEEGELNTSIPSTPPRSQGSPLNATPVTSPIAHAQRDVNTTTTTTAANAQALVVRGDGRPNRQGMSLGEYRTRRGNPRSRANRPVRSTPSVPDYSLIPDVHREGFTDQEFYEKFAEWRSELDVNNIQSDNTKVIVLKRQLLVMDCSPLHHPPLKVRCTRLYPN